MNKFNYFLKHLSGKVIIVILCLLLWGGLTLFSIEKKNGLQDQNAAVRWSHEGDNAQISCFFAEGVKVDENKILEFRHNLDSLLMEASITAPNASARLWVDAYSAQGSISLSNGTEQLEAQAIGVGGDFFFFHPMQLLYGAYFTGEDLMQDRIIIDEEAAWKLFGSNDVVGMQVQIGGIPHMIAGVIKRETGRFHSAAGLKETMVYVSYQTLTQFGITSGINTYEVVMPNPVKDFAYSKVKEKFGMNENSMWVVENSARYGWEGLLAVASEFGIRSMSEKAIDYPYWENVARGWEDVLSLVFVLQILCILISSLILMVTVVGLWRRRNWTIKDVGRFALECKDGILEKIHGEKNKWEHF
ncbi:MAG: ABC transporter permease [Lachnospiraceae bacterium]|nr:ABC transporter permease [Lachnospiraceae bacterium]